MKTQRLTIGSVEKNNPTVCSLWETLLKYNETGRLKVKE